MPAKSLTPLLFDLSESCGGIEASVITTRDGLLLASTLPESVNHRWAVLFGLSHSLARQIMFDDLEQVTIKGRSGDVIATHAGSNAVLAVLTKPSEEFEHLHQRIRSSADRLAHLIGKNMHWI